MDGRPSLTRRDEVPRRRRVYRVNTTPIHAAHALRLLPGPRLRGRSAALLGAATNAQQQRPRPLSVARLAERSNSLIVLLHKRSTRHLQARRDGWKFRRPTRRIIRLRLGQGSIRPSRHALEAIPGTSSVLRSPGRPFGGPGQFAAAIWRQFRRPVRRKSIWRCNPFAAASLAGGILAASFAAAVFHVRP